MLNLLGEHIPALAELHRALPPTAHLHWYDKREARPGRKMAHLNVTAPTLEAALSQLQQWNLRPLNELLENGDRR
jgi:5-(carboxyamino)imidazole ribonucleotide synthase